MNWIRIWILPGAVFQSVIVGGGYGTGREVVEFVSRHGPAGGLAALLLPRARCCRTASACRITSASG